MKYKAQTINGSFDHKDLDSALMHFMQSVGKKNPIVVYERNITNPILAYNPDGVALELETN